MAGAVLLLRRYLKSTRFKIRTDHDELRWIFNVPDASGKHAQWRLGLSESEFDAVHRASSSHHAAEGLSALPTNLEDRTFLKQTLPVFWIVPANNAKDANETDEKQNIVSEATNTIAGGLPAVCKTATSAIAQPCTAEFPTKQVKDPLCR